MTFSLDVIKDYLDLRVLRDFIRYRRFVPPTLDLDIFVNVSLFLIIVFIFPSKNRFLQLVKIQEIYNIVSGRRIYFW